MIPVNLLSARAVPLVMPVATRATPPGGPSPDGGEPPAPVEAPPTSGVESLFRGRKGAVEPPPDEGRLPLIRTHIERRFAAATEVLDRLERVRVWGTPDRERLPTDTQKILAEIEGRREEREALSRALASLVAADAPRLSRQAVAFDLKVRLLGERVARHQLLGRVFRSQMVDLDWALQGGAVEPEVEAERPGLDDFFESEGVEAGYRGRIRLLIDRYEASLRDKKGGELGPLPDEPFDETAFAAVLVDEFDPQVVADTLRFFQTRWERTTPSLDAVRAERDRLVAEFEGIRARRRPLHPERFEIVAPAADEGFRDYARRFGLDEKDPEVSEILGIRPTTILQWGQGGRVPRDIGLVIALYRFLVGESWRREVLYGRSAGIVPLPDPMELLRLAYGGRGRHFFERVAADDPWTIEVPVPAAVLDLSYAEMFYGRVLGRMWEAYQLRTGQVTAGIREIFEEGVAAVTYDRHRRAVVMPHRRFQKTRESVRLLFGDGGDVFDFFLEAKSVIDQVAEVGLPGERRLTPEGGSRSHWKVRLIPQDEGGIDFTAVRPDLDPERFPYRHLQGGRDDFTLLLAEVRARLDFLALVWGRAPQEGLRLGEEETAVTLGELRETLRDFETRHQRYAARLAHYRSHPADTPLSAPRTFEQFYRRLLLFARTVRNDLSIWGEFAYGGLSIRYAVLPPGPPDEGRPVVIARPNTTDPSRWEVGIVPDHLVSLVSGLGPSLPMAARLLQLRVFIEVLRERGTMNDRDLPRLVGQLFPDMGEGDREALLRHARSLQQLEAQEIEVSRLHDSNPDVIAIYERADQTTGRQEGIAADRWERWVEERLAEFSWKRFGLPARNTADLLGILRRYFELNPGYRETFVVGQLDQAIRERVGADSQTRGHLLEFLGFIGLPAGEGPVRRAVHRPPPLPPELRAPRAEPSRPVVSLPEVPVYPSRQSLIVDDFLDAAGETPVPRDELGELLRQLTRRHEGDLRGRRKIRREDLEANIRGILQERERLLGVGPFEATPFVGAGHAFLTRLQSVVEWVGSVTERIADPMARPVARELLLQMVLRPSVEDLASMTLRLLGERVRNVTTESSAFRRALPEVLGWFRQEEKRARQAQSDLLGLFEIAIIDHKATTRERLFELLCENGRDLLPEVFSSIQTIEGWEKVLSRHEVEMTLFSPEGRSEVRRRWHEVYDPLPTTAPPSAEGPAAPPPAAPAGGAPAASPPRTASGAGPHAAASVIKLPVAVWDPADYTHLPESARGAFWGRVGELASREDPVFLIFHLTEDGAQVTRVGREDWERGRGAVRGSSPRPYPGMVRFTDLESGGMVEVLPTQVRFLAEVDAKVRGFIRWLSELGPEDPSYPDIRFLESLTLYLPLSEEANRDYHQMVKELVVRPSRRGLRQILNQYVTKHRVILSSYRIYRTNMGPWVLSEGSRIQLGRVTRQDPRVMSRVEKVFDMLETIPDLPAEVTRPLREAVRNLEAKAEKAEGDYRVLIDRFLESWPEAIRRDRERLRGLFPSGSEFQPLAEAPELLFTNSADLVGLRHQMREDFDTAGRDTGKAGPPLRQFYGTIIRILDDPGLEPLHRVFRILLVPDFAPPYLTRRLIPFVNALTRPLWNPKRRGGTVEEILRLYLEYRDELLWRLKECEGGDGFRWAANALPAEMPRRFALSPEFPEFEEVSFSEIDAYRGYLSHTVTGRGDDPPGHIPDLFVIDQDDDGLWERILVPTGTMLIHTVYEGGRGRPVPIGIRVGDKRVYFRVMERVPHWRDIVGTLPEGAREIRLTDATGREVTVHEDRVTGDVGHLATLRADTDKLKMMGFELLVLSEDGLRDLHPVVMLIFNTVVERKPDDSTPYGRLKVLANRCLDRPQLLRTAVDEIRQELLSIYRQIRPSYRSVGLQGRFRKHFDNPPTPR